MGGYYPKAERNRHMKTWIPGIVLLLLASSSVSAVEHMCTGRNGHDDELLRKLYYYALLAESAQNGEILPWSCTPTDGQPSRAPKIYRTNSTDDEWNSSADQPLPLCGQPPCVRQPTTNDLEERLEEWNEIVSAYRAQGWQIAVYEPPDGGPAYFVCDTRQLDVMLFISLAELQAPVDDGDLRPRIVRPIIWYVENRFVDEALQTVTLRKHNSLSDETFPEQVTAIRGTDPTRLSHWRANANDLVGTSCVFSLMASVMSYLVADNYWHYAITGHSLGGAVAQYIAQHYHSPGTNVPFRSFAFNAVGLDTNPAGELGTEILHSFSIQGDPVSALGQSLGRTQGGRVVQYVPPADDTDFWNHTTALTKHALRSVQRALCDCMNGRGSLNVRV